MLFEAVYQPTDIKNLNPEAKKHIGKIIALQDGWRLEKGPYKGQICFLPSRNFGVIAGCDLKHIRNISNSRWKEIHDNSK